MIGPRPATTLLALAALGAPATAQSLADARAELSANLAAAHFAKGLTTLVVLSNEVELSGAHYDVDDDTATRIATLGLPFSTTFSPWGEERTGVYVEGVVGYARATQSVPDLYQGMLPGLETTVGATWTTFGVLAGIGPEFVLREGLRLALVLDLGLGYVQNVADYSGAGAAVTSSLLDGIGLNWDVTTGMLGSGLRLDWERPLGDHHDLELVARYDLRFTRTLASDDPAQDFSTRGQFLTLRGDVVGPTGWVWNESPVGWRTTVGFRRLIEGDLFGVDHYAQLGGSLEWQPLPDLPGDLSLSGAWIVGEDLTGWTVGVGLSF